MGSINRCGRLRHNAPSMDARVAKALRNSPHRNELKYLFLLSYIQDENTKSEIIREHLPSMRILSDTVGRFMCIGGSSDRQASLILKKYPVVALLTHQTLVQGLIVYLDYKAIQVQINFERFLDRTLLEMRRLREMTPDRLFEPSPSPASSLRSASSLASLHSAAGFVTSTPRASPVTRTLEHVRRRLENLQPRELFPHDEAEEQGYEYEELSDISWRSVRQRFQARLNDAERRRNVTMEEDLDITMSSINSQDREFQREYFSELMQIGEEEIFIGMEDAEGFGTPSLQPGIPIAYLDLATPLEDEDDPLRPRFRIVEIPNEDQPFSIGDDLEKVFRQEFNKEFRLSQLSRWQPQDVPQSSPQTRRPPVVQEEELSPISHPPVVGPSRDVVEPSRAVTTPVTGPSVAEPSLIDTAEAGPSWAYPAIAGPSWADTPAIAGPSWAPDVVSGPSLATEDVPSDTGPSLAPVPSISGPVLNPLWAPFPIYVDEPEPERPKPTAPAPVETPQPPSGPQPLPFSAILDAIAPPDPDHPVFQFPFPKEPPLRDVTSLYERPEPEPPKPKRTLGKMTQRLKFQSTRLWMHSETVRGNIDNPQYKTTFTFNERIKRERQPIMLDVKGDPDDSPDWGNRTLSVPVLDTTGIFQPMDSEGQEEEEELSPDDLSANLEQLSIERDDEEGDSWETIDEYEDELIEFLERKIKRIGRRWKLERTWKITLEGLLDEGWFYNPRTDPSHYQKIKEDEPWEPNPVPEFPPKFRYRRTPLISFTILRYYPNWHLLRHPSELPPPPPGAEGPVEAQAVDTATTSSVSGKLMQTGSVISKSASVDLPPGISSLEAHTFSSLLKKPSTISVEGLKVDSVQTASSGALGLGPPSELEETTVVMQPQEGALGTEQAQAAGLQTEVQPPQEVPGLPTEVQALQEEVTGLPAEVQAPQEEVTGLPAEVQAPQEVAVEVPREPGAPGGEQPAEFQFAVPAPVVRPRVRPRRIRRVPVRYRDPDDEDEDYEPPRRRRRRRPRREPAEVPGREPGEVPPPPQEVGPEDIGPMEVFPPPLVDAGMVQGEVQEPETPKVWDQDRVKELLRNKILETHDMLLRFSDLCEPNVCSRKSAASFFSVLLELDAQRVINLRNSDNSGNPQTLFIEAYDCLFNEE